MLKLERGRVQQQAIDAQLFPKQPVVGAFAIGCVADQRMIDVLQMAAQLVPASGLRATFQQTIAGRRIAIDRPRPLDLA